MKFLLVGSQFAPGAPAMLAKGLPQRAEVLLQAEPDNPYDALAVKVLVGKSQVVRGPELEEALAGHAIAWDDLTFPFMLGHLGASMETKAAKAAVKAGLKFMGVKAWHELAPEARSRGVLVFEGFGPITVEVSK